MTRRIEILTCTHCGVHGPHLEDNGSKLLECRHCLRLMNYETGEVITPGDPKKTRAIIEEEMRREKEEKAGGLMDDANKVLFYEEALEEIILCKGEYNRNSITHCENAIKNMRETARKVLERVKEGI